MEDCAAMEMLSLFSGLRKKSSLKRKVEVGYLSFGDHRVVR